VAVVIGESEAWASVRASLHEKKLKVSAPADLTPLLHTLRQRQAQGYDPLYQVFDKQTRKSEVALADAHVELASETARQTKPLFEEACQIEQALEQYRTSFWLRRYTILLFPMLRLKHRKKEIYAKKEKITVALHNDLLRRQQKHDYVRQNRTEIVVSRYQQIIDQAAFVEQVLHSPELFGAQAELNVLACLRKLPEAYQVHCDLKLRAHRSIRFAGEYLQSAQIDYLVVGPSGVFVLEVKHWSRQFIAQKQYFDPYLQVGRASYLCYDLLRTFGETIRVQSMIVNCGVLPPPEGEDYHVQVVTPLQLLDCLTRYRGQALDAEAVNQVIAILSGFRPIGNTHPSRRNDYPRRRRRARRRGR
jgi:hypothetical protein